MSCWHKTTVLRIPAIALGFEYFGEWNQFLKKIEDELGWGPGWFDSALCENYPYKEYDEVLKGIDRYDPKRRLDLNVYPELIKSVPGPFLDYYIEEIVPLKDEDREFNMSDGARPLRQEEKEKYLPLYQKILPGFTLENMEAVHYCQYEWYDGAEAQYLY